MRNDKMKFLRRWARVNKNRYRLLTGTIRQRERYRRIALNKRKPPFTNISKSEYKEMSQKAKNIHRFDGYKKQWRSFDDYSRWYSNDWFKYDKKRRREQRIRNLR
ncbi:hypothetical protein M9Y10_013258 [Tritrichomonas musculus]|uniref:Uncharacterized protein n=1 Tax=Tritrichomonas musculus TaxID=1915356 RepID=A0ABR2I6K6_9EUKA